MKKKLLISFLIGTMALSVGCSNKTDKENQLGSTTEASSEIQESKNPIETENNSNIKLQDSEIKEGETIATLKTNMGDIKMRFFPEQAPKAVENFLTHSKNGYYDGITFHRVIDQFMIQGGDPNGNGTGGESIWGEDFENEISPELSHIYGAVSMANAGPDTNGSQFFIVQNKDGAIHLDGAHTVFGQVIEGMETVESIAKLEKDENDKPLEDVIIESIELSEYSKES